MGRGGALMLMRLKLWLAGVGAALVALVGIYLAGRRAAKQGAATDALRGYADTRKRIDDADNLGSDPAVLRDWLRERGKP